MDKNMMVNGLMIKEMVKEFKMIQMVIYMMVNGRMIKKMVKEFYKE